MAAVVHARAPIVALLRNAGARVTRGCLGFLATIESAGRTATNKYSRNVAPREKFMY